jgi:hypothetical protein
LIIFVATNPDIGRSRSRVESTSWEEDYASWCEAGECVCIQEDTLQDWRLQHLERVGRDVCGSNNEIRNTVFGFILSFFYILYLFVFSLSLSLLHFFSC